MAPPNILIVGCGIAGPVLASFLLLAPLQPHETPHITILERSASLRAQGQNIDIRGAGATVMRKLGIETAIRAATTGEDGLMFVDAHNRTWGSFPADKSGHVSTATSDIEILRGSLAAICQRRSSSLDKQIRAEGGSGIDYIFGDSLDEIEQDGQRVHVRFAKSKERRSYDIVVGADGLQSSVRRLTFGLDGEKDRIKSLEMFTAFFSMPKGPTDSKWQRWFNAPGRRSVIVRPSEEKDRSTAAISIMNTSDHRFSDLASRGRDSIKAQKALLREYFKDAGWEMDRILKEMDNADDFYYDMVAQVRMEKWHKGRVVLLGDAGYCGSPISGMGTTLALNGAYNLAGALTQNPQDVTAAFAQYERKMRPLVDRAQQLPPGAPHLANPETTWGIYILRLIVGIITLSHLTTLFSMFAGPPANAVPVEDFGFKPVPENWAMS